ncbi:molybdopterin oxidoreductase family protein [Roseomonas elaeocarpi]|uniref:Molybdopterin oxidoreductase family protein n=1 Tax=Roseomonas elaeocarpi TaxID=907779 RepID=A0ABV6JN87_9PROT
MALPHADHSAAIRTTCPYCGVGCGVLAAPDGTVAGDPAHPANAGRLCSKGAALGETLALPDRLLFPEVGGRRASWDAALDAVAEGFSRALEQGGPENVGLYVSGQLLTEDYYAANKLAKGFLGTGNIDSNSRLCMASAVAAHKRAFGEDLVPGLYADLEQADLVVLVGSNLAWCHPVLHQRLIAARAARPGMRLVVVDPRRTASVEGASLHLPLRPGSDVALFAALLAHLEKSGALDRGFIASRTAGLDAALEAARAIAPEAAALTGLDPAGLATFFRWFAATPRTVTLWSQGVNQSTAGTDKANAIINVHLATGRIGRPGMGPFSVTGQPNAMGGREVGALATTLAAHLDWDRPGDAGALAQFWRAPALARGPGLRAVDMFRALGEGRLGALWVMATNPAVSLPDSDAVRAALARAPFLVVSDCSRASDTLAYAHVRLPALGWGEKDGTVTNSERVISRQRAFLPAPGEARADWWMIAEVAKRLGFAEAFAWQSPADIFREHAALSALAARRGRVFDIGGLAGLDEAGYAVLEPTRWPVPEAGMRGGRLLDTGALRFVPTPWRAPAHQASAERPLTLLTGRLRDQWHTMTRTGFVPRLMTGQPEPLVTLHPADAPAASGTLVEVTGAGTPAILRLATDPGLPRGVAFLPMHWGARLSATGRSNPLLPAAVDPVSAQPELKHAPVSVRPWAARWHGFVLAAAELPAGGTTPLTRVPLPGGFWRHELAGQDAPENAFVRLRDSLSEPGAAWRVLQDPAAGQHRAVLLAGGCLRAALFLAPDPALLPARDWLATLLGQPAVATRRALLGGGPADGPPPSRTVCACHGVTEATIRAAIAAGAATVAAVGTACAAGTGCGACRPELAALLPAAAAPVAA